ncbi:hypothetical protein G3A43_44070 [Paraburkholderia aspalathi]|uniref:hypothetical protein n=1 Tax=Paraburkholderia nemoris TaxID=2793076 RepID=UPI00190CF47D|nr:MULTISPECIES: hypothetical protein [Paraburkholderia]MBK3787136.1 hypothetical protein [Paraburkholderia aspalathi]
MSSFRELRTELSLSGAYRQLPFGSRNLFNRYEEQVRKTYTFVQSVQSVQSAQDPRETVTITGSTPLRQLIDPASVAGGSYTLS